MDEIVYKKINTQSQKFLVFLLSIGLVLMFSNISYSYNLTPLELKIWNDPAFQKKFTESYIAETEIEPRITMIEREKMQKILELISDDNTEEAMKLLTKSQGEAASAVIDFTLANIYFQKEDSDNAIKNYLLAVEKYPKFLRAWKNLGIIYVRQNDFKKALPVLTRVIELGGKDAISYGLLAYANSSQEQYVSAETAYRMAILLDPVTLDWKMGLARSLFKQEKYAEASSLCEQLIAERPESADLWMLQANAFLGLKQIKKAVENYELIDHLGKSTVESLNMLGDIYINEEAYELAVYSYMRAMIVNKTNDSKRPIQSAKILMGRGAIDEAQKLIEFIESKYKGHLSDTEKKDILKIRARIAVSQGAGEEEVRVLEEIVSIDPLDGEVLILLGQHYSQKGESEKAIFYYQRAAGMEKYEAESKIQHARLLVREGKYKEALPLLKRAQMIKPRENVKAYIEQIEKIAKGR